MTDKELEKVLTMFQTNLAVVQAGFDLRRSDKGQELVEKAIGNLSQIIDKLK